MRYLQCAAAVTLAIGAALAGSSASAATLITAAGGTLQNSDYVGTPYDNIPTGTLSIRGLGNAVAGPNAYNADVELAGTGFLAGMTGLGRYSVSGASPTNFMIQLTTTFADQLGFTYELDFTSPRNITIAYNQVFAENTAIDQSSFNGVTGTFAAVSFTAVRGNENISVRRGITNSIVSNNTVPFVPIAPVTPAVPEPATWAMMMIGLGAVGYTMRRRQKVTTRVRFA